MTRRLEDWLPAYLKYAAVTEAPKRMHLWSGIAALAGVAERKIWIDMKKFRWYPSMYIMMVAPPGVVSKSTTVDLAVKLLRQVPGVNMGPDIVTWEKLVCEFEAVSGTFIYEGEYHPMAAMTLAASELGSLIQPQNREMVNLYITLWDSLDVLKKSTKTSGDNVVECPWINMIGCTTPHWIADNMPMATIGGGFTSRCIFVWADQKEKFVAYVDEVVDADDPQLREDLIHDLDHIHKNVIGPYSITKEAREWGTEWYENFWTKTVPNYRTDIMRNYAARKQTHMHKVAMMLSLSRSDDRVITGEDLQMANYMLEKIEPNFDLIFSSIGRSGASLNAEEFLKYMREKGEVSYTEAYRNVHLLFPDERNFENIVAGCITAGHVALKKIQDVDMLYYKG